ncbi:MAG: AAA family ATPase [Nanoarchaeota archaeon]
MIDPLSFFEIEPGIITTVFGPAGIGKTTYCLLAAKTVAVQGNPLVIDTECGVSGERLKQIGPFPFTVLPAYSFLELQRHLLSLSRQLPPLSMLIVDSIATPYRLELAKAKDPVMVNRAMAVQLAVLARISRRAHIPVILVNHAYTPFGTEEVQQAGGDLLEYWSKCIVELRRDGQGRLAILRKHRFTAEGASCRFRIIEKGFEQLPRQPDIAQDGGYNAGQVPQCYVPEDDGRRY